MGLFDFKPKVLQETKYYDSHWGEYTKIEEVPEYIWVEGYKGTDCNMQCRDHQYEIGKKYIISGEVKICNNGYHFCKEMKYVFDYYKWNFSNRYFKVKALVNKNEWERHDDKYVATAIILTEELVFTYEELVSHGALSVYCDHRGWQKITMPKSLFAMQQESRFDMELPWYINEMKNLGHSELFAELLTDELQSWAWYVYIIKIASGLAAEGLSNDMRAYLLWEKVKEIKK